MWSVEEVLHPQASGSGPSLLLPEAPSLHSIPSLPSLHGVHSEEPPIGPGSPPGGWIQCGVPGPSLAPEEGSGLGPPAPGQQPPGGLRGPQPGDHLVTQTWDHLGHTDMASYRQDGGISGSGRAATRI